MKKIFGLTVIATALFFAACGEDGLAGKLSLVKTGDEPAGENCLYGGIRIEAGIDTNGNSTLDPNEVKDIRFVCNGQGGLDGTNGEDGTDGTDGTDGKDGLDGTGCTVTDNEDGSKTIACGEDTTVTVNDGAAGADGADGDDCTVADNGDGTKTITCGDTDVTVSNGANGTTGHNSLVVIDDAPAGTCPNGGQKVTAGIDLNDNGTLDTGEITATKYICDGVDGNDSLTVIDPVVPGTDCAAGGYEIMNGVDSDGDGTLDAGEIVSDVFVCNGVDGTNGTDGHSAMTETTPVDPGADCPAGGYLFKTGVDVNDNGMLDAGEYEESLVCSGEKGDKGDDGVCAGNHAPVIESITMAPPDGIDDSYKLDVPYALTVTVTDEDGDTPTYKIIGGYATIVPGTTAGEFELTPRAEGGPFTYAVIVSDGCQITMGDLVIESVSTDPSGGPYFMGPPFIWFTDVIGTGFTVNWDAARDDMTATEDLEYKVVYALDPEDIDTIEEIEAGNGIVGMDWTMDTYTAVISDLEDGVEYSVVVLVRDEYHLMNMYIPGTQRTPDVTAPTTDGTIWIADVTETTLSLSWAEATDNATAPEDLEFKLVYSTDPDEIDTVQEISDMMGPGVLISWDSDIYLYDLSGLDEWTTYYFNVAVRDSDGNVTLYSMNNAKTLDGTAPDDVSDIYAIGLSGRVYFRWNDPAGDPTLDHFEVTWTPDDPATPVTVAPAALIRFVEGLTNDTEYTFTIVAVDLSDNRSTGATITVTPEDPGMAYALTGRSGITSALYSLDPSTAETTLIGDTGNNYMTGFAIHPDTGVFYSVTATKLHTIDPLDASFEPVGDLGSLSGIPDLAFAANGTLYGWSESSDDPVTLDLATGAATLVGESNVSTWSTGLAFDNNGTLWVKPGNELWQIDLENGAGIYVADVNYPTGIASGDEPYYDELRNALDFSPATSVAFSVVRTDTTTYLMAFTLADRVAIVIGDMGVTQINSVEFQHPYVAAAPVNPLFTGIKRYVPLADLTDWEICHTSSYAGGNALSDILDDCDGDNLMLACRKTGSSILTLAAWAPRADVTFDTGTDATTTHNANGVDWYYNGSWSWGFLPAGATANKDSCDGGDTINGDWNYFTDPDRMCWHTNSGNTSGGWRCGTLTGNNGMDNAQWEQVVLHYTP